MRRKLHIRQTDSYDCGAACLASAAAWWGITLPLSRFRRECGCSKDGISIRGIADGAESLGLCAKAMKAEGFDSMDKASKAVRLRELAHAAGPVIAHTVSDNGMFHYVVIFKVCGRKMQVMDPAKERIRWLGIESFAVRWTGYIILIVKGQGYVSAEKPESRRGRLLRLINLNRKDIALCLAGSVCLAGIGICNSLLLQVLIDRILPQGNLTALARVAAIILAFIPLSLIIGYMRDLYLLQGSISLDTSLITGFMKRILGMDERFFKDYPKGELEARLGDTAKIRTFICQGSVSLGVCLITLATVCALMFTFYSRLATLLVLCIPVYLLLLGAADRINRRMSRRVMAAASDFENDVIDSIEGHTAIRHFDVKSADLRFNTSFSNLIYKSFGAGRFSAGISGLSGGISQTVMALILIIGGAGVIYGNLSLGELVSFYTLSVYFVTPVASFVGFDSMMNEALVASDRLYDITSSYILLSHESYCIDTPPSDRSAVLEFRGVDFRYTGGRTILKNFSHSFACGTITGIQGPSGCGKSTLVSLMMRDYRPTAGTISFGGIDISTFTSTCFRDIISVVPQSDYIFNATVFDNIAMTPGRGEKHIDPNMLERALRAALRAGMEKMLQRLDKGLLAAVGPSGTSLSGGEKQMILVARMLYADSRIMVFDESSSNIDRSGRQHFARLLNELREAGKCVIVVSHDENLAQLCNQVIQLTG